LGRKRVTWDVHGPFVSDPNGDVPLELREQLELLDALPP
jgi:hypothetical protein